MDDATLARLEHDNMFEWLRISFAQPPGAQIRTESGVGLFSSGLAHPFFNQILTDDDATPAGLAWAVGIVRERPVPFYVVLRRGPDDHLESAATGLGLVRDAGVLPGMALHPVPPDVPPVAGFAIRRIEDDAGLAEHAAIAGYGFELDPSLVRAFIGERLWLRPGCTVYVGYADGAPATSGFAVRTGRTIGVYTIATVPEARGRGYGEAMTRRIIADGAAAGCDVSILQASAMGRPIYERIGYREVISYNVYLEPRGD